MDISRRNLLRQVATGAVATMVVPSLAEDSLGAEPRISLSEKPGQSCVGIRLNRNENAYGPSARAIAAMQEALTLANRHSEAYAEALQSKIAALYRVEPEQVVLGCGSSAVMRMAVNAFVRPGKKLIIALPTFDLIGNFAQRAGGDVTAVGLTKDYSHNLDAMLGRTDDAT